MSGSARPVAPAPVEAKEKNTFQFEVQMARAGGTPIAKWIDVKTGEPKAPWNDKLRPKLEAAGDTPTIVLCQQSLQWVFGKRTEGIHNPQDDNRIALGADAIEKYADPMKRDGADLILIAMHIYKHPMEPEIGNERLALAAYLKRKPHGQIAYGLGRFIGC